MNKITVIGRITKKPTMSLLPSNIPYVRFNVACKSKMKNENGEYLTNFFPCVAWREKAENIVKYCDKGDLVFIGGSMNNRPYEKNGQEQSIWELNVEDIEFLTSKEEKAQNGQKNGKNDVPNELTEIEDDDNLPF